jgi:serine/threonine protein phosphatase 1
MAAPSHSTTTQVRSRGNVDQFYPVLRKPVAGKDGRIWAVGAIHGEIYKLEMLHDAIATRLKPGDCMVYLGNYMGYGYDVTEVLTEILRFRCWFMARPPFVHEDDFVMLRGAQEEMFQKLLQIQFAAHPQDLLDWMLHRGLEATLLAYGTDAAEGYKAAKEGTLGLTYWTTDIRRRLKAHAGQETLVTKLKRAAFTEEETVLFVAAGLDNTKPLQGQADALWWAPRSFEAIDEPYRGFRKVVRGYDPDHRGLVETDYTVSLDAGAGRGGTLMAACLTRNGALEDIVTV